jgi:hypothetical protein
VKNCTVGLRTRVSVAVGYLIQRRSTDAFIIAHPRSGSTWLRTILTNIILPDARSDPDVFNALIRGVSVRSAQDIRSMPSPRLLTSHTAYLPGLPKVLYMVRDGRDAIISFYEFSVFRNRRLGKLIERKYIDFSVFLDRYYAGEYGHVWDHHVESWLGMGQEKMGDRLMLLRYEDLKKSTEEVVEKVAAFFSIRATTEEISRAVAEARIENMREIEKEEWKRKGLGTPSTKASFYRAGKKRNWGKYFSEDDKELFEERSARAFELAHYEFGNWDS